MRPEMQATSSSCTRAWPLPLGAELIDEGRVRFRLWAPACTAVQLEIEGRGAQAMHAVGEGLHELIVAGSAGLRYRYRISADLAVPDPCARAQAGDVHGASLVVDPRAYVWQYPDWKGRPWHETVILEVHAGLLGGFDGVRARLAEYAAIGITAIELMPIADFSGTRNWGYDGVLLYAPDTALGTPASLKALIDAAHGHGLMVYLDVVYNHFGPDGNYLHAYAPDFFDEGRHSPWGAAIDFAQPAVREFFIENALYWLIEYRFDGLRFDAVHAIDSPDFLDALQRRVRLNTEPGRQVHLMLENEHNEARHLRGGFDAQWNDDGHNVLHVLLTGEHEGYYANYVEAPAAKLARCLAEGFVYQGEPSASHGGQPRGTPSADLAPTSFILFLQNHDQIGNRAFGERLLSLASPEAVRAAVALQLLAPQIPLLFMGEPDGSRAPFLFFTDFHDELADAVREGRRKEFAAFAAFQNAEARARIPDPNALSTFEASRPQPGEDAAQWQRLYRELLSLRAGFLVPRLRGARALGAEVVGDAAVIARWRLGDGSTWLIGCNLASQTAFIDAVPPGHRLLHESREGAGTDARDGRLQASTTVVFLELAPDTP